MAEIAPIVGGASAAGESKKRKRTGKDRKEAKVLAEQQQARMAEIIAAAAKEAPVAPPPAKAAVDTPGAAAMKAKTEADAAAAAAIAAAKAEAAAARREPESIAGRIGLKAIHPLLKQAKTFETQRLIKKIRWSRSKEEDVTDMEAQNAALAEIQLHDLALSHLRTKISKHHLFKHNPLPTPIAAALTVDTSASTSADAAQKAKAENRLISSKVVADGMKDILGWVVGEPGARLVSRPMAAKAEREKKKGKGMDEGRKRMLEAVEDEEVSGSDGDVEGDEGEDVESGSEDEGEMDEEAVAADAAGWESGSVDDIGDSGDEDEESDDSGAVAPPKRAKPDPSPKSLVAKSKPAAATKAAPPPKPTKPAKPAKKQVREDITSSLFLPSLAAGFTRGDSDDSDPDMDFDADGLGIGKQGVERKNRRGQRARQAIWEKKYGKNAKHVVKSLEADNVAQAENNIKNAYGKRATAAGPGEGAAAGAGPARPAGRPAASRPPAPSTYTPKPVFTPSAAPAAAVPAATANAGAGLHPSWEAARRKKQLLAAAPAAQKIVFD